jgi:hypothetical protein
MGINQKDIKLLWGRSGNRCAICRTALTQDKIAINSSFTLGEQAHIIAESISGPRGKSDLSLDDRNNYHNLILLCPTHHTEIDNNPEDWSIEKLFKKKSEHELWVTETLSETIDHVKLAQQTAISSMIDDAVSLCQLENWKNWTSFALAPEPTWQKEYPEKIFKFREKIIAMIWPKDYKNLKTATITFSVLLHEAASTFMENIDEHNGVFYPHKFYKAYGYNENYDKDLKKYDEWIDKCHHLLKEATKAVNWFADEVRENINPMFFTEQGKFLISEGPFSDMSFRTSLLEFTELEKEAYLNPKIP